MAAYGAKELELISRNVTRNDMLRMIRKHDPRFPVHTSNHAILSRVLLRSTPKMKKRIMQMASKSHGRGTTESGAAWGAGVAALAGVLRGTARAALAHADLPSDAEIRSARQEAEVSATEYDKSWLPSSSLNPEEAKHIVQNVLASHYTAGNRFDELEKRRQRYEALNAKSRMLAITGSLVGATVGSIGGAIAGAAGKGEMLTLSA